MFVTCIPCTEEIYYFDWYNKNCRYQHHRVCKNDVWKIIQNYLYGLAKDCRNANLVFSVCLHPIFREK
jgi:hypothetical protein